jgi:hypothetical protein
MVVIGSAVEGRIVPIARPGFVSIVPTKAIAKGPIASDLVQVVVAVVPEIGVPCLFQPSSVEVIQLTEPNYSSITVQIIVDDTHGSVEHHLVRTIFSAASGRPTKPNLYESMSQSMDKPSPVKARAS